LIHVVGLGLGCIATLSKDAQDAIRNAIVVIGSQRQLSLLDAILAPDQQVQCYPSPFAQLSSQLTTYVKQHPQHNVCLLASGDPLFYGLSDFLLRHFESDQLTFYTNTSSIQTAFALIKKPWQQAKIMSLHGRPLSNLISYLANHPLIALLTDKESHPQAVANLLCQHGCQQSTLWICEALGTKQQKISTTTAKQLATNTQAFHPLHITIININSTHCSLPSFPGFEDTLFITDTQIAGKGMISKREVRLAALSLLQPKANQIAWDIGAGCGTVAVEWAYWNQQGSLYAVEHHAKRLICLEKNKHKFGVNNLHIVNDKAPQGLDNLPQPNAIFIGGSAGKLNLILDVCWTRLITGGCLVINCVTEPCKIELQQWLQRQNIADNALEWTEIAISKGDQLAGQLLMRPRLPVRLLKIVKY
jgi:precorrin-6Y C5,15-methyltransferase (decarboxylating)